MQETVILAKYSNIQKERGCLFWTVTYHNYSYGKHIHDFYELNIVLSGTGTHQIEDCSIPVRAGDIFVIPPSVAHSYQNSNGLDVFHLVIHPDFIRNNITEARSVEGFTLLTEAEPFLRRNSTIPMFLHLTPAELAGTAHELEIISEDEGFYPKPLVNHTVWMLLYTFSHMFHQQLMTQKKQLSKSCEGAILQALDYIHTHYSEKLTIKILCDKVFMSRSTFLRKFSELCRCTPIEYITSYRIKKAVQLMQKEDDMPRSEIAHMCGFYDLSHMDRSLKKYDEGHFII